MQEEYIPKKCPETISKIAGLIHKSLITYNLYKAYVKSSWKKNSSNSVLIISSPSKSNFKVTEWNTR